MIQTSIMRLAAAVGYPGEGLEGASSSTLQVDGADVFAEETGGRLRLSLTLGVDESRYPVFAGYAAGRMLREDAALAYDKRRGLFLWQEVPSSSDSRVLARFFETFLDSCDWWRDRVGELSAERESPAPEMFMIRP